MAQTTPGFGHSGRPSRVLVVDDDLGVRDVITETLQDEGYEVTAVGRACDALDRAASTRPDVILLDVKLPDLSAEELARRYRATPGPHAPLVVVSGTDDIEVVAARVGAAAVLPKPFEVDQLLAVLAAQLRCVPA